MQFHFTPPRESRSRNYVQHAIGDQSSANHSVVLSMPGFAQWKRDLTVMPGSDLTVGATLQKQ